MDKSSSSSNTSTSYTFLFGEHGLSHLHKLLVGLQRRWRRTQALVLKWQTELATEPDKLHEQPLSTLMQTAQEKQNNRNRLRRWILSNQRSDKYQTFRVQIQPLRLFLITEMSLFKKDSTEIKFEIIPNQTSAPIPVLSFLRETEHTTDTLDVERLKILSELLDVTLPSINIISQTFARWQSSGYTTSTDTNEENEIVQALFLLYYDTNREQACWKACFADLRRSALLCAQMNNIFSHELTHAHFADASRCDDCNLSYLKVSTGYVACPSCGKKVFTFDCQAHLEVATDPTSYTSSNENSAVAFAGLADTNGTASANAARKSKELKLVRTVVRPIDPDVERMLKQRLKYGARLYCFRPTKKATHSFIQRIWQIEDLPQGKRFTKQIALWFNQEEPSIIDKEQQNELRRIYLLIYKLLTQSGLPTKYIEKMRNFHLRKICLHKVQEGNVPYEQLLQYFPLVKNVKDLAKFEKISEPIFHSLHLKLIVE